MATENTSRATQDATEEEHEAVAPAQGGVESSAEAQVADAPSEALTNDFGWEAPPEFDLPESVQADDFLTSPETTSAGDAGAIEGIVASDLDPSDPLPAEAPSTEDNGPDEAPADLPGWDTSASPRLE